MTRAILGCSVLAVALLGFVDVAAAHHPPRFERCERFTFTGQLERIEWGNPDVLLFVRTDSGVTREVGWLNVQALQRAGIDTDTLHIGDHLVVQGGTRPQDVAHEPILVSSIHRPSDGWEWSQPLQGC
jgi:Family of unknown function (DUF6152)